MDIKSLNFLLQECLIDKVYGIWFMLGFLKIRVGSWNQFKLLFCFMIVRVDKHVDYVLPNWVDYDKLYIYSYINEQDDSPFRCYVNMEVILEQRMWTFWSIVALLISPRWTAATLCKSPILWTKRLTMARTATLVSRKRPRRNTMT